MYRADTPCPPRRPVTWTVIVDLGQRSAALVPDGVRAGQCLLDDLRDRAAVTEIPFDAGDDIADDLLLVFRPSRTADTAAAGAILFRQQLPTDIAVTEHPAAVHTLARVLFDTLCADTPNEPLLTHVALALRALLPPAPIREESALRGGLAAWQERRAVAFIEERLDQSFPVAAVAAACGLSVNHFSRAFRRSMGKPPHRWLLERRIEKAQDLLRATTLSLADIALACGFAEQSHFTRVFTRMVGTPPGAWRRSTN